MAKCFVIQPFDGGKFDKRYDQVLAPAISKADLEPYRVDRDPSTSIPIEDIESAIEESGACVADITNDNPNVWFELGYAIASRKEVILICDEERKSPFPFDIQHRKIIRYSTESPRDFENLARQITQSLKARIERASEMGHIARLSPVVTVEGLEQHEIAVLVAAAQQLDDPTGSISTHHIRSEVEKVGFTKIATTLGIGMLLERRMLESVTDHDYNGEPFKAFRVTAIGMGWLHQNRDRLKLKVEPQSRTPDDIPF